ncbi:MAG: winged helix-turn-helix transcriptional regulator [Lysobacterales bacterium]
MFYPAKIQPDGASFLVTFRDIPEAITSGKSGRHAESMARDALVTAMDFYFEDRRKVPPPSKPRRGEIAVPVAASVAAKVLLLNQMIDAGITASELARKLNTSPQAVNRIVDIHHATKIDTIAAALQAMGRRLELSVA